MNFLWIAIGIAAGWVAGSAGARRAIRRELGGLREGIALHEAPAAPPPATIEPPPDEIPVDVLPVITAAVAAFFGKKARIRGIRRVSTLGGSAWAQQGRVYVQGSHNLQRRA
ncbi:MAG: hypothetical protein IT160_17795 [Bryobacterales bacterium]|nr:hypothetical protein [Bryobacterales bacterium]